MTVLPSTVLEIDVAVDKVFPADALLSNAEHLLDLWDMLPPESDSSFWSELSRAAWGDESYFMGKMHSVRHMLRQYVDGGSRSLYAAQYLAQYVLLFFDREKPAVFELLDKVGDVRGEKGRTGRRWAADATATAWRLYVPGRAEIQRSYSEEEPLGDS